jgi:hypothetical protein
VKCALTGGNALNTPHRFSWFLSVSRTERAPCRVHSVLDREPIAAV